MRLGAWFSGLMEVRASGSNLCLIGVLAVGFGTCRFSQHVLSEKEQLTGRNRSAAN